jgi:hypothetical protein
MGNERARRNVAHRSFRILPPGSNPHLVSMNERRRRATQFVHPDERWSEYGKG